MGDGMVNNESKIEWLIFEGYGIWKEVVTEEVEAMGYGNDLGWRRWWVAEEAEICEIVWVVAIAEVDAIGWAMAKVAAEVSWLVWAAAGVDRRRVVAGVTAEAEVWWVMVRMAAETEMVEWVVVEEGVDERRGVVARVTMKAEVVEWVVLVGVTWLCIGVSSSRHIVWGMPVKLKDNCTNLDII